MYSTLYMLTKFCMHKTGGNDFTRVQYMMRNGVKPNGREKNLLLLLHTDVLNGIIVKVFLLLKGLKIQMILFILKQLKCFFF